MEQILKILRSAEHYGGGYYVEFAKGSHQIAVNVSTGVRKFKRLWRQRKL